MRNRLPQAGGLSNIERGSVRGRRRRAHAARVQKAARRHLKWGKSMLNEFKAFAMRGNVIDMAVGIIIGAAFGKIVASFVKDIIMPPIGLLLGGVDFSGLFINLSSKTFATLAEAEKAGAPTLNYGLFINTVIDFLIISFAIFIVIKQMNRLKKEPPPADPTEKDCPYCLSKIPIKATKCAHCTSAVA
jgi:large conductance mechanosensitive channel